MVWGSLPVEVHDHRRMIGLPTVNAQEQVIGCCVAVSRVGSFIMPLNVKDIAANNNFYFAIRLRQRKIRQNIW